MSKPNLARLTEPLRPTPPVLPAKLTKSDAIRLAVAEGYGPDRGRRVDQKDVRDQDEQTGLCDGRLS